MIIHSTWEPACGDCRAPFGAPCDEACPSAAVLDHENLAAEVDDYRPACCPRGALCECQIGGAA